MIIIALTILFIISLVDMLIEFFLCTQISIAVVALPLYKTKGFLSLRYASSNLIAMLLLAPPPFLVARSHLEYLAWLPSLPPH